MEPDFMLGTNYWASHAGADMWRDWDAEAVEADLRCLEQHGITHLRVFPNWRDFQPVEPLYGEKGSTREPRLKGERLPANHYYLEEEMLEHFGEFCRIAERCHMKLIVGLITGWMSGRLFVPPILWGKDIYRDPLALKLEQLLVQGIVTRFKEETCILAWDLGNECNCMGEVSSADEAYNWTLIITNAIKAADNRRPVISGMHSLELEDGWKIQDQGEITDILTTHPYPFWVEHCSVDPIHSIRTLLHATIQNRYYKSIGRKPCLVEEIGTMGPMISNDGLAAGFMRVNLFSNWANGAAGLMWWCANEQSQLTAPPYDWNMCERELGMLDLERKPKPMLLEMKQFSHFLQESRLQLPPPAADGICILSRGQDHWGTAYMTGILAKQAGITLDYTYCEQELPDSQVYLLPSVQTEGMYKSSYDRLKQRVAEGAVLYISLDNGFLTEFEEFTGVRVEYSSKSGNRGSFIFKDGTELTYTRTHSYVLKETRAEVIARDERGNPVFTVASYGKGRVYLLNLPLESMLLNQVEAFTNDYYAVYQEVFSAQRNSKMVVSEDPFVSVTEHHLQDKHLVCIINYSNEERRLRLKIGMEWELQNVLYGNAEIIRACDSVIFEMKGTAGICGRSAESGVKR